MRHIKTVCNFHKFRSSSIIFCIVGKLWSIIQNRRSDQTVTRNSFWSSYACSGSIACIYRTDKLIILKIFQVVKWMSTVFLGWKNHKILFNPEEALVQLPDDLEKIQSSEWAQYNNYYTRKAQHYLESQFTTVVAVESDLYNLVLCQNVLELPKVEPEFLNRARI